MYVTFFPAFVNGIISPVYRSFGTIKSISRSEVFSAKQLNSFYDDFRRYFQVCKHSHEVFFKAFQAILRDNPAVIFSYVFAAMVLIRVNAKLNGLVVGEELGFFIYSPVTNPFAGLLCRRGEIDDQYFFFRRSNMHFQRVKHAFKL